jgi:peptidoglycan hydrolase CwlO-like protein
MSDDGFFISLIQEKLDSLSKEVKRINSNIRELDESFRMMVDDMEKITKKIEKKGETTDAV